LNRVLALLLATASLASMSGMAASQCPISAARMSATVKTLASDAFEGRAPGTPGEEKTVEYLIRRFRALGLRPAGEHGGWTQQVPLIHNTMAVPTRLEVNVGGSILSLVAGRDITPRTIRSVSQVTIHDAPMVFVGYGVAAPERDWDDCKGSDLTGKVAIFLVNDPQFEAKPGEPVAAKFGGRAMTYYGRWTYKFEEAARRGAVAALVIHETAAAGYDWKVASSTVVGS
jgi:PA domain